METILEPMRLERLIEATLRMESISVAKPREPSWAVPTHASETSFREQRTRRCPRQFRHLVQHDSRQLHWNKCHRYSGHRQHASRRRHLECGQQQHDRCTAAGAGNLISGNGGDGLSIGDTGTTGNLIQGNLIGVNSTATSTIGNGAQGIWIGNGAQSNTIGGTVAGAGNVIGGSTYAGIELNGSSTSNNIIQGNFIGTNSSGTVNLGNSIDGILVTNSASNNTIGGTVSGAGNTIAFNGRDGIRIESTAATGNAILGNNIYSNSGLGINLAGGTQNGFGVTSNDSGDGDAGANSPSEFPTISSAGLPLTACECKVRSTASQVGLFESRFLQVRLMMQVATAKVSDTLEHSMSRPMEVATLPLTKHCRMLM